MRFIWYHVESSWQGANCKSFYDPSVKPVCGFGKPAVRENFCICEMYYSVRPSRIARSRCESAEVQASSMTLNLDERSLASSLFICVFWLYRRDDRPILPNIWYLRFCGREQHLLIAEKKDINRARSFFVVLPGFYSTTVRTHPCLSLTSNDPSYVTVSNSSPKLKLPGKAGRKLCIASQSPIIFRSPGWRVKSFDSLISLLKLSINLVFWLRLWKSLHIMNED